MPETISIDEARIADGGSFILTSGGGRRKIRVFRVRGEYYALANSCPHEGGPVCEGVVTGMLSQGEESGWKLEWVREGEILYCPWHGTAFEISSGRSLVRGGLCIRSYPVKVVNGKVTVTV